MIVLGGLQLPIHDASGSGCGETELKIVVAPGDGADHVTQTVILFCGNQQPEYLQNGYDNPIFTYDIEIN